MFYVLFDHKNVILFIDTMFDQNQYYLLLNIVNTFWYSITKSSGIYTDIYNLKVLLWYKFLRNEIKCLKRVKINDYQPSR